MISINKKLFVLGPKICFLRKIDLNGAQYFPEHVQYLTHHLSCLQKVVLYTSSLVTTYLHAYKDLTSKLT